MSISQSSSSGILLVDKPAGLTSHDVVARAKRLLHVKKVGHAGTLDPFATGLLVLLIGEGTKLSANLMEGSKLYTAEIKLGEKTDTADSTGTIIERKSFEHYSEETIKKALEQFVGTIKQKPPMYSALKKKGTPLYKLARKGIEVDREEREVTIKDIELLSSSLSSITLRVLCSKGTYVRTLAEAISETLGTCGHLKELRRLESGTFCIEDAVRMENLEDAELIGSKMITLSEAMPLMPQIVVGREAVKRICDGNSLIAEWIKDVKPENIVKGQKMKVVDSTGTLLSLAEAVNEFRLGCDVPSELIVGKSLRVFNGL
ncbi:MAG: tRNA pseudouridine(55) synthase TruB [Proteobacteria bacterium]|nr:tRNA pseudouridine(55) synthase TruB [Pseudomonadota bacterium]